MNGRANRRYQPEFFPGTITLFNTVESKFPREDLRLMMRPFAGEILRRLAEFNPGHVYVLTI